MTPAEVAAALQIEGSTLRRWAGRFAAFLSPGAQQPSEPGQPRTYSDADIAVLREIQAAFATGQTTAQITRALQGEHTSPADRVRDPEHPSEQVIVLDEHRPELDALRQLLDGQRQHIAQQAQHITDQNALLEQQTQLLHSLDRQVQAGQGEHDRLRAELTRAHDEHAALLIDVRRTLGKIPRWLRALLGLGA